MKYLAISKTHISRFTQNQRGSVVVEFLFSIILLLAFLFFMFDLTLMRGNMGKLDNLSYSLVSLLAEEKSNKGNVSLSAKVDVFRKLAKEMYYGEVVDKRDLYLTLASLENGVISYMGDQTKCSATTDLKNIETYIPKNQNATKKKKTGSRKQLSVYQVTVCVPMHSTFEAFFGKDKYQDGLLRSSSLSLGHKEI